MLVHGDDFVAAGHRRELAWFKEQLQIRFDVKTAFLGLGEGEGREGWEGTTGMQ